MVSVADAFLAGPFLAGFLAEYAHVALDVSTGDARVDIVAGGYDAGIQLGEVIDKDMIAVPVSGDIRLIVVGSPAYFGRHRRPAHPRDLVVHECINWHRHPAPRPTGGSSPNAAATSRSPCSRACSRRTRR